MSRFEFKKAYVIKITWKIKMNTVYRVCVDYDTENGIDTEVIGDYPFNIFGKLLAIRKKKKIEKFYKEHKFKDNDNIKELVS